MPLVLSEPCNGQIALFTGDSFEWDESHEVDLILTNIYGPLPVCLADKPMLLCQRVGRHDQVRDWIPGHPALTEIGRYGHNENHAVWAVNFPVHTAPCPDLAFVGDEVWRDGNGWFPLDLPLRLLQWFQMDYGYDYTVWDGFCGRGTVGKACQLLGHSYIGIDRDPARIAWARSYLGI